MHRTKSKNITSQLKGVVKYLRRACTRLYSAETTPPADEDSDIISEVSRETTEYSPVSNSLYSLEPCVLCASEVYHSIRGSDAFSKHKYASVADLCSNLGSRLPLQLVKLVARDTLRALKSFHQRSNRAYRGKFLYKEMFDERWGSRSWQTFPNRQSSYHTPISPL